MRISSTAGNLRFITKKIKQAETIKLILDYDGTLADFAPSPDHIFPDEDLIDLLRALSQTPNIEVVILSGRRLQHIKQLVPIAGLWRAGTYGIEIISPRRELIERIKYQEIRPQLELVKPKWHRLIDSIDGFYLEDKRWSLALHARDADPDIGLQILRDARAVLQACRLGNQFRVLGGDRFLEVAPTIADKGNAVMYLVEHNDWQQSLLLYIGDDDKDEAAFAIVQQFGGIAIKVDQGTGETIADATLGDPSRVREWLNVEFIA